jgi:orotidine-5'-phosphate decarboxylase
MTREGPVLVRELIRRGQRVFLDLKWHDIPNTVAGAVAAARELGVSMATVHTLGGTAMMEAAAAAASDELALVGVTVLTSHGAEAYGRIVGRPDIEIDQEARRLARSAMDAGLRGVVCSPREVGLVRQELGSEPLVVVPGIRRQSDPHGDQARTASARAATADGASHLVVGRPVLQATDPAAALAEFMEEARCVRS